jgi:DNA polymerase-3 subunit gamma/tau
LLSFAGNRITAADVHRLLGTADDRRIAQLVDQVVLRNAAAALAEVDAALAEGVDCGQLLDQLLGYFRDLMVLVVGGKPEALLNISATEHDAAATTAGRLGVHTILAMMQIVEQALTRLRYSLQGRIVVEMTIVRLCSLGDLDELPLLIGELRGDSAGGNRDATPLTQGRSSVAAGAAQAPQRQLPASARPDASNMSASLSVADNEAGSHSSEMQRSSAESRRLEPENVDQLWRDALATITDMTADHASLAEQLAIDDQQRLVVVFPAKYTSSRNFCERPERRQQIEKAVAQLVGRHVQIVFQLGEEAGPQSLDATRNRSGASPWERLQQAARHPLIRRAAELFDARPKRVEETGR